MTIFLAPSAAHLRPALAHAGYRLGRYAIVRYPDGERTVRLRGAVSGEALLVGSVTPDAESVFLIVALHQALLETGARVRLAVPYLSFARLDRLTDKGESAAGLAVARVLRGLGAPLTVLDVHSEAIRRALGSKADDVSALSSVAALLRRAGVEAVVAPDHGALGRARKLARLLPQRPKVAWIEKTRRGPGKVSAGRLHGRVRGKNVLVIDDLIDTGGTIRAAVRLLAASGAREIRAAATHGVFSKGARAMLARLPIRDLIVTDSLPQRDRRGLRVIGVVPIVIS